MSSLTTDLKKKTALVTGAGRGIGRAVALELARCGATVIVNYHRNAQAAEQVVQAIEAFAGRAWAIQADVSRKDDVDRLFTQVRRRFDRRLDILVNNAGGPTERHPLATMPESVWDQCLAVNLKSAFLCTQAAWDLLPDGSGRIVNVTSISARTGGGPGMAHYAAAKAAMSNFTRACAKEFAPRRITVNAVAPGVIDTDLHRHGTPKSELEQLRGHIPLARLGEPDEVAAAVLFLCSQQASYLTGEVVAVNGGLRMN